ncbi:unnamed protein product [Parascedosporium putredinis]|uniref:Uncharacterized protein n=1 Tax=Parascedosporium putredinis TaxID=1442378 RepID=A0A9P1HA22_9PEZI|nr:unnamed protein product [Parascedosporium putredinis]CAI8002400.1 unnamed protein product [Parascedosporium putredinis]
MAPVPLMIFWEGYVPPAISTAHVLLVTYLTFVVSRGLYRSYLELPPSQATRSRKSRRRQLVPIFAALALVSLAHAVYIGFDYALLSYKVWAARKDIALPIKYAPDIQNSASLRFEYDFNEKLKPILQRLWGHGGIFSIRDSQILAHASRWLAETPIYADAFEIVTEKARRHWWGQQLDLAMLSWTLLLSIEGRRRNIPFTWAYLGLAHLVGLSFAQNLFHVALLLTPAPVPSTPSDGLPGSWYIRTRDSIVPPKPLNWCPHPLLYLFCYALNGGAIFLAPALAGTASSVRLLAATRALTFLPLLLPYLVPESWGTVHPHPHRAYSSFSALFRLLSGVSLALHARATLAALARAAYDDHRHRHSALMHIDAEKLAAWERTTYGLGRILGARFHHPSSTAPPGMSSSRPPASACGLRHSLTRHYRREEILARTGITTASRSATPSPEPARLRSRQAKFLARQPSTSDDEEDQGGRRGRLRPDTP